MELRPQMSVAKATPSLSSMSMPAIIGFKTPQLKEKALIRVKKIKRGDNIIIPGEIDEDYVDIVEEEIEYTGKYKDIQYDTGGGNFFASGKSPTLFTPRTYKRKTKYLKNCYIIDYIQSPKPKSGLGTEAIKQLAEKAMFDNRAEGRIVTFSAPVMKEASPALFFYKLGFRFTNPESNAALEECLKNNMPDIPPQIGMMYLPKNRINKLFHY
jgi:signal peptidase I